MNGYGLLGAFWGLVALALLTLAIRAWMMRTKSQSLILPTPASISDSHSGRFLADQHYVASVLTDSPLERVTAHGLGLRGRCDIAVDSTGIALKRKGESDFFIPAGSIASLELSNTALGRAVEPDGLTLINWHLGDTAITTVIRFPRAAERNAFMNQSSILK